LLTCTTTNTNHNPAKTTINIVSSQFSSPTFVNHHLQNTLLHPFVHHTSITMTSTPISDASQQEHNTNESREQPAQQSPSLQQNSTSNETQDQQLGAEEPPARLIPETSKTPSFTNSDKYIPVTARFHESDQTRYQPR
jgi:hypothetical protein